MGKSSKEAKVDAQNEKVAPEPQKENVVSFLKPSEERLLRQGKLVSKPNKKTKKMRDKELLERQLRQVENEDAQANEEAEDGLGQTTFDDLMQGACQNTSLPLSSSTHLLCELPSLFQHVHITFALHICFLY